MLDFIKRSIGYRCECGGEWSEWIHSRIIYEREAIKFRDHLEYINKTPVAVSYLVKTRYCMKCKFKEKRRV